MNWIELKFFFTQVKKFQIYIWFVRFDKCCRVPIAKEYFKKFSENYTTEIIISKCMIFVDFHIKNCEFFMVDIFVGKKWKSLTPSERAPCVQEAERLRLKHMQVGFLLRFFLVLTIRFFFFDESKSGYFSCFCRIKLIRNKYGFYT